MRKSLFVVAFLLLKLGPAAHGQLSGSGEKQAGTDPTPNPQGVKQSANGVPCRSNAECASNCCLYNEESRGGICVARAEIGQICGLLISDESRRSNSRRNNNRFGQTINRNNAGNRNGIGK